jgi:tetratricopeptide (TPR) repeat protein
MWIQTKESEVQALHARALESLGEGDLDSAEKAGEMLRMLGWSGAFEVLALVARERGELERAVSLLEEGVALAPSAWGLHQLRGNLLDQLKKHDDALAAFDTALKCEGAWLSSIRYNRAVARLAWGDIGGALEDAEFVITDSSTPPFYLNAMRVALEALARLGRTADGVTLVRHVMTRADGEGAHGPLSGLLALALARDGQLHSDVEQACQSAIDQDAMGEDVLQAFRLLRAQREPELGMKRFAVLVEVSARGLAEGATGYYRKSVVHARDRDDAVQLALSIEPPLRREVTHVERVEEVGAVNEARGVFEASSRLFFGE